MVQSLFETITSNVMCYTGETYLKWWNSFVKNRYKGFLLDGRGNLKRIFLDELNMVNTFKLFMKSHKKLSVRICCEYLSNCIR